MKSLVLATFLLLITAPAMADQALLQKHNCMACHAVDKKLIGPAYKDVAARYAGQADAAARLSAKIKNGGSGNWGGIPMPPHPQISDADLKKLSDHILKQR